MDFPTDGETLRQTLNECDIVTHNIHPFCLPRVIRHAKKLDMPAACLQTVSSLAGELKALVAIMRNTLHLAVSISPLVVLCPRKMESEGIRRDYLISVLPHPSYWTVIALIGVFHSML
jgi:hypothetical protein